MSQLTGREPGVVGAALDDPDSWCGIIVDGEHTDPVVLRISMRCKRHDRFMLVTDAMPSVGTNNKSFVICRAARSPCRATCAWMRMAAWPAPTSTWRAACATRCPCWDCRCPKRFGWRACIRRNSWAWPTKLGRIAPGYRANFVVADDQIRVSETWIDGAQSYGLLGRRLKAVGAVSQN